MLKLFGKYFIPKLLGILCMLAATAIDGIFVGHGVGCNGVAAINIYIPLLIPLTDVALMLCAGCSVVVSILSELVHESSGSICTLPLSKKAEHDKK